VLFLFFFHYGLTFPLEYTSALKHSDLENLRKRGVQGLEDVRSKEEIAHAVIDQFRNEGGRFIAKSKGGDEWFLYEDDDLCEIIQNKFRNVKTA